MGSGDGFSLFFFFLHFGLNIDAWKRQWHEWERTQLQDGWLYKRWCGCTCHHHHSGVTLVLTAQCHHFSSIIVHDAMTAGPLYSFISLKGSGIKKCLCFPYVATRKCLSEWSVVRDYKAIREFTEPVPEQDWRTETECGKCLEDTTRIRRGRIWLYGEA